MSEMLVKSARCATDRLREVLEVAVCNAVAVENAYFKAHPDPFTYVEQREVKRLADDIQNAIEIRDRYHIEK